MEAYTSLSPSEGVERHEEEGWPLVQHHHRDAARHHQAVLPPWQGQQPTAVTEKHPSENQGNKALHKQNDYHINPSGTDTKTLLPLMLSNRLRVAWARGSTGYNRADPVPYTHLSDCLYCGWNTSCIMAQPSFVVACSLYPHTRLPDTRYSCPKRATDVRCIKTIRPAACKVEYRYDWENSPADVLCFRKSHRALDEE